MTTGKNDTNQKCDVEGLTTLPSAFGTKETMDRIDGEIRALGMRVFARIDHAALAAEAGLQLRPTELLIFGNPRAGTPLMQSNQTMGIELPLKMLVWQDTAGKTWFAWNNVGWLAQRHGVETESIVGMMAVALGDIAKKVTSIPCDVPATACPPEDAPTYC
jgi:uncharacterized protein (DUF302 family)